jgi:hypothetical protein
VDDAVDRLGDSGPALGTWALAYESEISSPKLVESFVGGKNKALDSSRRNVRRILPSSESPSTPNVGSTDSGSNHLVVLSTCARCFGTDDPKNARVRESVCPAGNARSGCKATRREGLSGTGSN